MVAYPSDLNTRTQMRRPVDFGVMQAGKDAAEICGECGKHLGALSAHAHQAHGGLWVCSHLDAMNNTNSIYLSLPTS